MAAQLGACLSAVAATAETETNSPIKHLQQAQVLREGAKSPGFKDPIIEQNHMKAAGIVPSFHE